MEEKLYKINKLNLPKNRKYICYINKERHGNMKVAIIGSNSFSGSSFVNYLINKKIKVFDFQDQAKSKDYLHLIKEIIIIINIFSSQKLI